MVRNHRIAPLDDGVRGLFYPVFRPSELSAALGYTTRARYEADRARRCYQEVEPEFRLVARTLERDWNEKLSVLDQLERDYAERAPVASSHVSEAERQGILDLVHDLPAVWRANEF